MIRTALSIDGGISTVTDFPWSSLDEISPYYHSTSPSAIILVAGSFWALIISIPGLAWHIKNRNLPAASMVAWIVLLNIQNIVNALIWPNDNITAWWNGEIYCDIEIKLEIAATMGLVGALACIFRALATALDTKNIRLVASKGQRIRQLIFENCLCVIFPLLLALLHIIIQPIRYYIFAIAGCKASYQGSWLTLVLGYMWPPIICLLICYYAILLMTRIYRYRRDFSSILSNSTSGMNKSRFIRLFGSATTVFIVVLPLQAYAIYINTINTMNDTWHTPDWNLVKFVPMYGIVFSDRWVRLGMSIPVFVCFGWGRDANSVYKAWLKLLGLNKLFPSSSGTQDDATTRRGRTSSSSPRNRKSSVFSSDSATLISKARSLFSLKDTKVSSSSPASSTSSTSSNHGIWSSRSTLGAKKSAGANSGGDIESQHSGIELTRGMPAISTHRVNEDGYTVRDNGDDKTTPFSDATQIDESGSATVQQARQKALEYEDIVVGRLT